jgi:hypothetical protein
MGLAPRASAVERSRGADGGGRPVGAGRPLGRIGGSRPATRVACSAGVGRGGAPRDRPEGGRSVASARRRQADAAERTSSLVPSAAPDGRPAQRSMPSVSRRRLGRSASSRDRAPMRPRLFGAGVRRPAADLQGRRHRGAVVRAARPTGDGTQGRDQAPDAQCVRHCRWWVPGRPTMGGGVTSNSSGRASGSSSFTWTGSPSRPDLESSGAMT